MKRFAAVVLFGLALTGTTLAGSGMAVAPHIDPPGTPVLHDHVLSAYRFPLFLIRLQERLNRDKPHFTLEAPLGGAVAALVMALLVIAAPRLPRPTLRAVFVIRQPLMRRAQWSPPLPLAPPEFSF